MPFFRSHFLHYEGSIGTGTAWANEVKFLWNLPHCSIEPSNFYYKHSVLSLHHGGPTKQVDSVEDERRVSHWQVRNMSSCSVSKISCLYISCTYCWLELPCMSAAPQPVTFHSRVLKCIPLWARTPILSSSETSMRGLVLTGEPEKTCLIDMAPESVTAMASSYSKHALSSSSSSPILSFNYLIGTGHHGCTLILNNSIC